MALLSLRAPTGFCAALGDLCAFEAEKLAAASAPEIEALNQGGDLAVFEHLVLDAAVHLDARADAFHVSVLAGEAGDELRVSTAATLGEAVRELQATLDGIWTLGLARRRADTRYPPQASSSADAAAAEASWIVTGGTTIVLDALAETPEQGSPESAEPMRLVFAAVSSHRSIAVYRLAHDTAAAAYVGLVWALPVGALYERVFFDDRASLVPWLRLRLRQDVLPRRTKRA
jgi:hypothetical protein